MDGNAPLENLARPIVRQTKTAASFLANMKHPFRGGKVNYLREPSFRAWLLGGIPVYLMAARRQLGPWRWLLIVVPHIYLLDAEANNTAHEESIRSHRRQTWHFRNAMDSASFSVMLRFAAVVICVGYAFFGPEPRASESLDQALARLKAERFHLTAKLESASAGEKRFIRAKLIRMARDEGSLLRAQAIQRHEEG